jgi:hypothetical protein
MAAAPANLIESRLVSFPLSLFMSIFLSPAAAMRSRMRIPQHNGARHFLDYWAVALGMTGKSLKAGPGSAEFCGVHRKRSGPTGIKLGTGS